MKGMLVEIKPNEWYKIEEVAWATGYSTGHLRTLEKRKKIPKSSRDGNGWRIWIGSDVMEIKKYKDSHRPPLTQQKETEKEPVATK